MTTPQKVGPDYTTKAADLTIFDVGKRIAGFAEQAGFFQIIYGTIVSIIRNYADEERTQLHSINVVTEFNTITYSDPENDTVMMLL